MTIRFDQKTNDGVISREFPQLMLQIEEVVRTGDYDLRSIYSAITALKEVYREAMRTAMGDKDQFDAFIDSMDVLITSFTSRSARPYFESVVK